MVSNTIGGFLTGRTIFSGMPIPFISTIIIKIYHSSCVTPFKGNIGEATINAVDTVYATSLERSATKCGAKMDATIATPC